MLSRDTRMWAMFCHLGALVGLLGNGIGFILGPLVVWLVKREEDPFIDAHGKEALNFQLSMLIYTLVSIPLIFVIIGIFMLIAIGLLVIILPIIAGIRANDGGFFRYPLTIRMIK